jgi:hypothetical protein
MKLISLPKNLFFLLIICLLSTNLGHAVSPIQVKQKGAAIVTWEKGKKRFQFNQAIAIDIENRFISQAIDDFGNTLFWFVLSKNELSLNESDQSKVKKLLRMPISSESFLEIIQKKWKKNEIKNGKIVINQKSALKKKTYQIELNDFRKVDHGYYPYQITITHKKTKLDISWQSLKFF